MRRMYSESQLRKFASEEAGKLDKIIPTDIGAKSDGALILLHDGKEIDSNPLPMKQLFGKYTLTGEGNIDLYYHSITIVDTDFLWRGSIISSSDLNIDSPQDLITVCANKTVNGSGFYDNPTGTFAVGSLSCGSTAVDSTFNKLDTIGEFKFSEVASSRIEDVVTTI